MGQCYDISLRLRIKDEEGAKKALQTKATAGSKTLDDFRGMGHDMDTVDGLLRHFYTGWDRGMTWDLTTDPDLLSAGFDASYGWESVMMEAFEAMAPYLEDGSEIYIYPDSDYDQGVVRDGKAVWLH